MNHKFLDRLLGKELAKGMAGSEDVVQFLMDLEAACRDETQTRRPPGVLESAPPDVKAVYDRYKQARVRLSAQD